MPVVCFLSKHVSFISLCSSMKATSAVRVAAFGATDPIGSGDAMKETKPPSTNPKGTCRFWMSDKGCLRGSGCKYHHPPLEPQSNRCFECSAVGHSRRDCPAILKSFSG